MSILRPITQCRNAVHLSLHSCPRPRLPHKPKSHLLKLQPRQSTHQFHATTTPLNPRPSPQPIHTITDPNFLESLALSLLDTLHHLGPWSLSIPLAAIAVRSAILPLDFRNRSAQQRFLDLQPLLQAWRARIRTLVAAEHEGASSTRTKDEPRWIAREITRAARAKKKELQRRWRAGWLDRTSAVLWQLPAFMTMMSLLRRAVMPEREDFLLARPVKWAFDTVQAAVNAVSAPTDAFGRVFGGGAGAGADATSRDVVLQGFETEGCLWFVDLTLADPTGRLPVILTAVNAANIFRHAVKVEKMNNFQKIVNSMAVVLLGVMLQASWSLPAGVVWYWTWSSTTTLATHLLVDRLRPLKKPPMACKRPARVEQHFIRRWNMPT